jgi:hypothetical protein
MRQPAVVVVPTSGAQLRSCSGLLLVRPGAVGQQLGVGVAQLGDEIEHALIVEGDPELGPLRNDLLDNDDAIRD